jgi:hypothetical protein
MSSEAISRLYEFDIAVERAVVAAYDNEREAGSIVAPRGRLDFERHHGRKAALYGPDKDRARFMRALVRNDFSLQRPKVGDRVFYAVIDGQVIWSYDGTPRG